MTRKPKKFGRGGAIAGLAGLGALAYMASKKGDKDKEDSGKKETYIDKQLKRAKEMPDPEPTPAKGIASDWKSSESKFERNDNEKSIPDAKKPAANKPAANKPAANKTVTKPKAPADNDSLPSKKTPAFDAPNEYRASKPTPTSGDNDSRASKPIPEKNNMTAAGRNKAELGTTYSRMYTRLQDPSVPEGPGKDALRGAVDKARKDYEDAPLKKGGKVKAKAYAKGGVTRGDGCAVRGKTKGKMY